MGLDPYQILARLCTTIFTKPNLGNTPNILA